MSLSFLFSLFVCLFTQIKRIITPNRTAGVILEFLAFLVTTTLTVNLLDERSKAVFHDKASYHLVHDKETITFFYSRLPDTHWSYRTFISISFYGLLVMVDMMNPILYLTIMIATGLLIIAFKNSIREKKSLTGKTKAGNSVKETRRVQSVIVVCVIFIVTSTSIIRVRIIDSIDIRWRVGSSGLPYYVNELASFLEVVNHSINIFVYLAMNSKFRGRF